MHTTPPPTAMPAQSMPTQGDTSDSTTPLSPSIGSRAQHAKRPLTPSESCHLPAKIKRPRNLAYPPTHPQTQKKEVTEPVGNSKQAVAKRKANESVSNGTFVHNLKRWDGYKRKLAQLDPNFEVSEDPRLVRQVKHSTCGGWFLMAAPYDKERFKQHVTSCSYSTGGSMKSLESFGIVILPASTLPSSSSSSFSSSIPSSQIGRAHV